MLKSLELAGFKSFADKTRLEFPAGVTVVVGPNGSGKSNVVDAIKWVLGSQSPRSLRGKEMTDVIFNGSGSRGPLNAAEVTLAFDNPEVGESENRLFDLDETEVRFTRRVYRSGEGEYLINGHQSRLRDFRELLAGTGVGADGYSIIEQGKVDAALQASPIERRAMFEEAAGISRFRIKKREAGKRLERVEQNLLRLSDIVDEVESRLRRVRSQAGKAQKYREHAARLAEARTQLGIADQQALLVEKRRLDDQQRLLGGQLAETKQLIAQQEEILAKDDQQDDQAQIELREAEKALSKIRERIARDRTTYEHEQVRSQELQHEVVLARKRLVEMRQQLYESVESGEQEALMTTEKAATACGLALEETSQSVDRLTVQLEGYHSQIAEGRLQEEKAKNKAKSSETEHQRLLEHLRATKQLLASLEEETSHGSSDLGPTRQELAAYLTEQNDLERSIEQSSETLAEQEQGSRADQNALSKVSQQITEGQAELLAMRHRLEVLAAEDQRLVDLNHDVRSLLEQSNHQSGKAPVVYGLVADLLHVDVDLAGMVEAALGGRTNHVVIDSGDALISAIENQTQQLTTRASFQRLDGSINPTAVDRIDLSAEVGVMGRASDFVESEPRFEPLLQRLLGRTWFVDRLETATRLSKSTGRGLTFVTYAGEVISVDGTIVVGPHQDNEGVLTRRRKANSLRDMLTAAEKQLQTKQADFEQLESSSESNQTTVRKATEELASKKNQLHELQKKSATLEERLRQTDKVYATRQKKIEEQTVKLQELNVATEASFDQKQSATVLATEVSASLKLVEEQRSEVERKLAAELARQSELHAAAERHHVLLASLRKQSPASRVGSEAEEALNEQEALLQKQIDRLSESERAILRATSSLASLEIALKEWTTRQKEALASTGKDRQRRRQLTKLVKENRSEGEELLGRVAQVELRRQQIETELRTLHERLRDHGIDLTEYLGKAVASQPDAESDEIDRSALRREIESLKKQVDSVGSVNLESLEELDDLETRFEQLSAQYKDLSQAKTSLLRLTTRINKDSRELYLASFEVIRGHFQELFQRMFGGGQADLVMVNEEGDDPLESGVEIVACPPGKELRSLSLLSGGEKTMTCVALLMALFRSKPSPFCILDEVDAALDEANIGRFTGVLNEFLVSTQFIVITHSKRTMTGADTLYGVTMQESGISKQVSVRFEDVSEDGHIRPNAMNRASTATNEPNNQRRAA